MNKETQQYLQLAVERLRWVGRTQQEQIAKAGTAVAEAIADGGLWYLFGSGHSHMLAEEAFYRAGGLVAVVPMLESGLMLHESALQSSYLERVPGYAQVIMDNRGLTQRDVLLVASNSGRNALPVEMARLARERGITTIAVTSLAHSSQATSRDPSGMRLFEVAEIVIDNGAPYGDALVEVDGAGMGPLSTITGAAIVNAIAIEAASQLRAEGKEVSTWVSANVESGHSATDYEQRGIPQPHIRGRYRHL